MMFSKCLLIVALSALMATAVMCDPYDNYDTDASEYGYRRSYPNANNGYPSSSPYSGPSYNGPSYNGPSYNGPSYNGERRMPYPRPNRNPYRSYRQYEEPKDNYKKDECNDLTKCCPEGKPIFEVKEKKGCDKSIWKEFGDNFQNDAQSDELKLSPTLRAEFPGDGDCARLTCGCGYQLRIDYLYCPVVDGTQTCGDTGSGATLINPNAVGPPVPFVTDSFGEVFLCCDGSDWDVVVPSLNGGNPLLLADVTGTMPEGSFTQFRASCKKPFLLETTAP